MQGSLTGGAGKEGGDEKGEGAGGFDWARLEVAWRLLAAALPL